MCVVVDGYKLYRVFDSIGIGHVVAGFGNEDAVARAKTRGVSDAKYAQWHEWYREYAMEEDIVDQAALKVKLETAIWEDVANNI